MKNEIKIFNDKQVRTVWDDEKEEWFFSVVDVVEILTESKDPKQYIKKMRSRDEQLNLNWGTICTLVKMPGKDGKKEAIICVLPLVIRVGIFTLGEIWIWNAPTGSRSPLRPEIFPFPSAAWTQSTPTTP